MKNNKELDRQGHCPVCKCSWDEGSILESFLKQREDGAESLKDMTDKQVEDYMKELYSPPYRWSGLIGVELSYDHPRHYDGVSYWMCPECKTTWNRFTNEIEKIP